MKITYDQSKNAYVIIYKDYSKVKQGVKYPYNRKQVKSSIDRPTKREQAARIKELTREYALIEAKTDEIEVLHGAIDEAKDAVRYLESLPNERICTTSNSDVIKQETRRLGLFITWLKKNRPGIKLHELDNRIVIEFSATLDKYSYTTFCDIMNRLDIVMRMTLREFKDSKLKYYNPFHEVLYSELREEESGNRRCIFSQDDLRYILKQSKSNTDFNGRRYSMTPQRIFQRYATIYMMMVTGWRIGDVISMRWEEVNLERRVITKVFKKTAKKHITARIYITDRMLELLYRVKDELTNGEEKGYLFPLRRCGKRIKNFNKTGQQNIRNFLLSCVKKLGLFTEIETNFDRKFFPYSPHSIRATAITALTLAEFNGSRIKYLVGHSPTTIEEKHYLKFENDVKMATKGLIEYMEDYVGVEYMDIKKQIADSATILDAMESNAVKEMAEYMLKEMVINSFMNHTQRENHEHVTYMTIKAKAAKLAQKQLMELDDKKRVAIMKEFLKEVMQKVIGEKGDSISLLPNFINELPDTSNE